MLPPTPSHPDIRHSGEGRNPSPTVQPGYSLPPTSAFAMDPDFRRGDAAWAVPDALKPNRRPGRLSA